MHPFITEFTVVEGVKHPTQQRNALGCMYVENIALNVVFFNI